MDFNEVVSNVKIYGMEESIKRSKYPMAVDINKLNSEENISYWLNFGNFMADFIDYTDKYNKNKGENNKNSCIFCGGDSSVQKMNRFDNNYYCSKCQHQFDRYGKVFENSPEYRLCDDYVEVVIKREGLNEDVLLLDYIDLPMFFYDKWSISEYCINKNQELLHRKIMGVSNENGNVVDHINKNKLDNRRINLRVCSYSNNSRNCNVSKNNTSGVTGVSYDKRRNKWRAYISLENKKQIFLGYFSNREDAIQSRLVGENNYFKEFAPQRNLFNKYGIEINEDTKKQDSHEFVKVMNTLKVMNRLSLSPRGSAHDNALHGIIVQFDLTFTVKAWTEAERYHWFEIISSQSTMHKITKFDLDKSYIEYVDPRIIDVMKEKVARYNTMLEEKYPNDIIAREYLGILYSNPCGCKLTAGMTTNYCQLKTIYSQRKNHRLPEWKAFCKWIETLPNAEWITGKVKEND